MASVNFANLDPKLAQFEECERAAAGASKDRTSLTTQLEDARRLADAETRERINLLGKMRNLQHELDVMREHLEEEFDAKQEVERQLSKEPIKHHYKRGLLSRFSHNRKKWTLPLKRDI